MLIGLSSIWQGVPAIPVPPPIVSNFRPSHGGVYKIIDEGLWFALYGQALQEPIKSQFIDMLILEAKKFGASRIDIE